MPLAIAAAMIQKPAMEPDLIGQEKPTTKARHPMNLVPAMEPDLIGQEKR